MKHDVGRIIQHVDQLAIGDLSRQADASSRKRSHMLLHAGHDDQVQRLMIALQPGSYVRPHRHAEQWELLALFRGVGQVLSFDNHGRIVDRIEMTTVSPVVQIPIGTWHGFLVLELNTIIMEIKPGPYRANEFADWAPPEGDASVADYLRDWRSSLRTAETE